MLKRVTLMIASQMPLNLRPRHDLGANQNREMSVLPLLFWLGSL